jgi:hypothetical protein
VLPKVDPATGFLPPGPNPYLTTLDEIHATFVVGAPFASERQDVFEALALYARLVWAIFPDARLRIDGGFITHKTWAAPQDADVVVVCPTYTAEQIEKAVSAPLFTMLGAKGSVSGMTVQLPKAHVMGGLVDGFFVPEAMTANMAYFDKFWSSVTDQNKKVVPGQSKGYVEVINPNATI